MKSLCFSELFTTENYKRDDLKFVKGKVTKISHTRIKGSQRINLH